MQIKLVCSNKSSAASTIFSDMLERVTGEKSLIATASNINETADLTVLIGNDAINARTAELFLEGRIKLPITYGADNFCIKTFFVDEKKYLILAGGRPRADIYAVYYFFEKYAGCRYFWDGDIIPKRDIQSLFNADIDIIETPRFEYRGTRYFAHRSLHRFQAEHWSYEDWKKEIDWLLKKRLNLFFLRIGSDDIFQKAFPDIVGYPDPNGILPEAGKDHDNRTLFWPLEFRAELRRKVLDYAFSCDLMHPEDCGTMTHWYSRTPKEYLEKKKPSLLAQNTSVYSEATGLVWDVRDDEMMEDYFKLTEAHVNHYGKAGLFHTIGLAERVYSDDKDYNKRLKQYVYHRIQAFLTEKYSESKLLVASWDFYYTYEAREVAEVVSQLDPKKNIVFDYTSDSKRESNFTNWGIVGKHPWIFGLFGGYEPNNEIRGDYALIEERLAIAKNDEKCIGFIFWPELSHGDNLMTEFFAASSWRPNMSFNEFTEEYCSSRYTTNADAMKRIWIDLLPIASMHAWSGDAREKNKTDLFFCPFEYNKFPVDADTAFDNLLSISEENRDAASQIMEKLSAIPHCDIMLSRDLYDIARTVTGRYISSLFLLMQKRFAQWEKNGTYEGELIFCCEHTIKLLSLLGRLLSGSDDFSMLATLEKLRKVHPVNPFFESAFKDNASNNYCRSYIYENIQYLYIPETKLVCDWISECIKENTRRSNAPYLEKKNKIKKDYNDLPLEHMIREKYDFATVTAEIAEVIKQIVY